MIRNTQFESKLKQFQGSANQVVNYVLNRENVAPTNSPLQTKLASLHKRLSVAVADVTVRYSPSSSSLPVARTQMFIRACVQSASTRRNNSFNNQQADSAEKAAVVALVLGSYPSAPSSSWRALHCGLRLLTTNGQHDQVHCLKEAGEIFAVNEARIKTSFNFTYEKLDQGTLRRS
jgi:hypothetical protein